jgi:hypothetical protein
MGRLITYVIIPDLAFTICCSNYWFDIRDSAAAMYGVRDTFRKEASMNHEAAAIFSLQRAG